MGLINSLYRRPAKPEELKYVWKAPEHSEASPTDDPTDIPEGNPMLGLLKLKISGQMQRSMMPVLFLTRNSLTIFYLKR